MAIYTIRCNTAGLTLRLLDEYRHDGLQIVVDGGPILGYTMDQIFADETLFAEYRDTWAPGMMEDVADSLRDMSETEDGDDDPLWLGLLDTDEDEVSQCVGRRQRCRHCRESPCYARKYLPIYLAHLYKFCNFRVWVRGKSMEGSNLRFVRKSLYAMPAKAGFFNELRRRPGTNGVWYIAPEGWLHNPTCVTKLVRFMVVVQGNYRMPAP